MFSALNTRRNIVHNLDGVLSLVTGQAFRDDDPGHGAGRLIANLLAIHNAAHGTLNIQTLVALLLLLADNQLIETLQMHQMLATTQRNCGIL